MALLLDWPGNKKGHHLVAQVMALKSSERCSWLGG
jgi:hypothetical protein